MTGLACMDDITQISVAYSYLGHRLLSGDVEIAKFLYGNDEKTVRLLPVRRDLGKKFVDGDSC